MTCLTNAGSGRGGGGGRGREGSIGGRGTRGEYGKVEELPDEDEGISKCGAVPREHRDTRDMVKEIANPYHEEVSRRD